MSCARVVYAPHPRPRQLPWTPAFNEASVCFLLHVVLFDNRAGLLDLLKVQLSVRESYGEALLDSAGDRSLICPDSGIYVS